MGVLVTILALGIVIFVHELGHYLMAKRAGIGVYEFSIGMGPKIFGWKRDETDYTLRILPIGGFVKLAGMDESDKDQEIPDKINYHKKSISDRFMTLVSGCLMNFALGLIIFFCIAKFIGDPSVTSEVKQVMKNSPAAIAGLQEGDKIIQIGSKRIENIQEQFLPIIKESPKTPLIITFDRNGSQYREVIVPDSQPADDGKSEIGQIGVRFKVDYNPLPWGVSIKKASESFLFQVVNTLAGLKLLFTGAVSFKDMAGPVGIVQFASYNLDQSWFQFVHFMAVISIVLGVFNLFPIPMLDGGHIFFLMIEWVRGRPLSEKIENRIYNVSAAVLISLMVMVVFNDVLNWQERKIILDSLR